MKSRISIEVDFDNHNQPVIQILQHNSDDVRDKLVGQFLQSLNGSSWCNIRWVGEDTVNGAFRIFISTLTPDNYREQAAIMIEQAELNKHYQKPLEISIPK